MRLKTFIIVYKSGQVAAGHWRGDVNNNYLINFKQPSDDHLQPVVGASSSSGVWSTSADLPQESIVAGANYVNIVKLGSCSSLLKCLNSTLKVSIQKQKEQS